MGHDQSLRNQYEKIWLTRRYCLSSGVYIQTRALNPWQSYSVTEAVSTEFLTVPDVATQLNVSQSKVRMLLEEQHLGAIRIDGILRIPASFISQGEVIPAIRGTLMLLKDAGFDNDEAVTWMLSENQELGETPISALIRGHKAPVRRAVQSLAF